MTPAEYRAALAALNLTQAGFARLLGMDPTASVNTRRWATGKHAVPPTVAVLLRLMVAGKVTPEDVETAREQGSGKTRETGKARS